MSDQRNNDDFKGMDGLCYPIPYKPQGYPPNGQPEWLFTGAGPDFSRYNWDDQRARTLPDGFRDSTGQQGYGIPQYNLPNSSTCLGNVQQQPQQYMSANGTGSLQLPMQPDLNNACAMVATAPLQIPPNMTAAMGGPNNSGIYFIPVLINPTDPAPLYQFPGNTFGLPPTSTNFFPTSLAPAPQPTNPNAPPALAMPQNVVSVPELVLPFPSVQDAIAQPFVTNPWTYQSYLERMAKIKRYKDKKRIWRRKVNYKCRQNQAQSRLRIKGRFISRQNEELLLQRYDNLQSEKNINPEVISQGELLRIGDSKRRRLKIFEQAKEHAILLDDHELMGKLKSKLYHHQNIFKLVHPPSFPKGI